jgi:5-(carboxyamino)imidazole ribonucleotide synthase
MEFEPILPPATIGVFGSGQLGRMLALAARAMGYRIAVFAPDQDSPAGQVADVEVSADYDDEDEVYGFLDLVDVATFEFENVPVRVAELADEVGVPVRPGGHVLHTAQHRLREKRFLASAGLPTPRFCAAASAEELRVALGQLGCPAVLKTASFGYDGKGQIKIDRIDDAATAWQAHGDGQAIVEEYVAFAGEVSMVAARGVDGSFVHYGLIENSHRHHILDVSLAPARVSARVVQDAVELTHAIFSQLDVVGALCVEFFVTQDDRLLINELAPRPHNSGHLTIEAAVTSQFEQQARAVCGLPLGSTEMRRPAAMANLLGHLWQRGEPNWAAALADPRVKLHLYGKHEARPGRKMGHLTALANMVDEAERVVRNARAALA